MADVNRISELIEALRNENDDIARSAAEALADIGESAVPSLIKALNDNDANLRANTVGALALIGEPAIPALINMLGEEDEDLSLLVANALVHIGELAIPALIEVLDNEVVSIAQSNNDRPLSATFNLNFDNRAIRTKFYAITILEHIGTPEALAVLERYKVREQSIPELIEALSDPDEDVLLNTLDKLEEIGESAKEAIPNLVEISLNYRDSYAGIKAIEVLGKIGAANALVELLRHIDFEGARIIMDTFIEMGELTQESVFSLIELLNDIDKDTRIKAAIALARIGKPVKAIVPALIEVIGIEDYQVKEAAIEALGLVGPDAKEAVPTLIKILEEVYDDSVIEALGRIGSTTAIPVLTQIIQYYEKRGWIDNIRICHSPRVAN